MYDIDIYTYWKKPFGINRLKGGEVRSIRPLDDNGRFKFYSRDSHNYHYLRKIDPFIQRQLNGAESRTLKPKVEEEQKVNIPIQEKNPEILNRTTQDEIKTNEENESNNQNNLTKKNNDIKRRLININLSKNLLNKNFSTADLLGTPKRGGYLSKFRPYFREKNFKDIFGYNKYPVLKSNAEYYKREIEKMKNFNFANSVKIRLNKNVDGFPFDNVPELENKNPLSASFIMNNDKMKRTLDCEKNGLHKSMSLIELKKNLINQTSLKFREKYHLPDILSIADRRSVIMEQKNGYSKYLNEKYNPSNYLAPSKNRTGRNYIGDLFKH